MTNAVAEAKRAYMRKWRAENKDKVKAHQQRYWERKAAELTKEGGGDNGKCTDSSGNDTTSKG